MVYASGPASKSSIRMPLPPRWLEILANLVWLGEKSLAASAEKKRIGRIQLYDSVNVRLCEGLIPLLHNLKRIFPWTCNSARRNKAINTTLASNVRMLFLLFNLFRYQCNG